MTAYYNEVDPFAAQWLRNLIAAGLIAPGVVDERSIVDVRAADLVGFSQCHFFAGIGGWSLALRLAGWPDDKHVWTGSCPCQPFSVAGKGKGAADERHLWPVWFGLIRECRPPAVFGEQVAAAVGHNWLDAVQGDLEGEGYAVGSAVLGAHSVGAPHIRQRLWFVADANGGHARAEGLQRGGEQRQQPEDGRAGLLADAPSGRCEFGPGQFGVSAAEGRGDAVPKLGAKGIDGVLADAVPAGRAEWRAEPGGGSPAGERGSGGMGNPGGAGSQAREREAVLGAGRRDEGRAVEQPGGSPGGVADADGGGPGARRGDTAEVRGLSEAEREPEHGAAVSGRSGADDRPGPLHGFWRDADWLFCRDGKWRPTQSALLGMAPGVPLGMVPSGTGDGRFFLSPLVQGAPSRVGRLRGYGNAIVPAVAAEFIGAYLDAGAWDVYGVQLSTGGDD